MTDPVVRARRAAAVDGAGAAFLFLLATPSWLRPHLFWAIPLYAALTLPLVARRRHSVTVFAVVAGAALVQWLVLPQIGPYDLAVLVALYTVAAYRPRRWSVPALAVGLTGAVMAWESVRELRPVSPLGLVPPVVGVVAVWLVGRTMRTRRRYLAELEERAARLEREQHALTRAAVAEERARIAREMHDVVAHTVAVMVAQAEGAGVAVRAAPDQAEHALSVISDAGRDALTELRRMLGVLRGASTDPATGTAPQPGIADLDALVAVMRDGGLPVRFVREGPVTPLDPTLSLAVYRIVQESLTNTLKHCGPGTPTEVRIRRTPEQVEVEVVDAGSGHGSGSGSGSAGRPGAPHRPAAGGHGLTGMRERVAVLAGDLTAGPTPRNGWSVRAVLPASAPA